jgi:plastocyanin
MTMGLACSDRVPPDGHKPTEAQPASTPSIPATLGSLEGEVLFEGSQIPHSTVVENTTDPQNCGDTQSLGNIVISPDSQGIKNVIVTLHGVPLPEGYQPEPAPLQLDNRNCQFEPHVSTMTTGSQLDAVNSDPIFHSVHLYGFLNRNLALGPNQSKTIRTVSRPGYYIVKCDVHGWMQAYFRVGAHPFHAVSSVDGKFRIENLPEGSYVLEVWHEYFGKQEVEVTIAGSTPSRITIYYDDRSPREGGA